MTLNQLSNVKRWHLTHRRGGRVESQVWDAALTCWLMGLIGLPVLVMLGLPEVALACVLLHGVPSLYVALRRRLHHRGVLRCDWLTSAARD